MATGVNYPSPYNNQMLLAFGMLGTFKTPEASKYLAMIFFVFRW